MAWEDFEFDPEDGLSNTTTFPSKPTSGAAARTQFMTILNQIKAFFNGTVKNTIDEHKAENAILIPKAESTANAIVLDIVLTDKKKGSFRASANNTGNMTINGKAFKKDASTQIPAGGVKANKVYDFYYDQATNSVFILAKAAGTAQPSHVLAPYSFSNDDGEQVGAIPSKAAATYTPGATDQIIAAGQYLSGAQTIKGCVPLPDPVAGDGAVIASATTDETVSTESYTKIKEIKILKAGSYRVRFHIYSNSGTTYGCIYKNGVAIGTAKYVTTGDSLIFTQDFTFAVNDLVQLYIRKGTSGSYTANADLLSLNIAFNINYYAQVIDD